MTCLDDFELKNVGKIINRVMEERHLSCRRTSVKNLSKFGREPVPLKSEYIVNIIHHL